MTTVDLKFVEEYDNFAKLQIPRAKLKCNLDSVEFRRSQDPFIVRFRV